MRQRRMQGEKWTHDALNWGVTGPKALKHFLETTGEDQHRLPHHYLYALPPEDLWKLHAPGIPILDIEREEVHSVHIYGHEKVTLVTKFKGLPAPRSYLEHLCARHLIDPTQNPVLQTAWMELENA